MKKYMIAGHIIAISYLSPEAGLAMAEYQYTGPLEPEQIFAVTPEAMREAGDEWLENYQSEIEDHLLSRQFSRWLAAHNGLYLHASAVACEGFAYAFTADPGTGKSTHARLWKQAFAEKADILNDDKPFLCLQDNVFYVCGSPWCGKEGVHLNRMVPLNGLCFLSQGAENRIERVSPNAAVTPLLRQTLMPEGEAEMERFLSMIDQLVRSVPLYHLECTISEDAARLAYAAMRP